MADVRHRAPADLILEYLAAPDTKRAVVRSLSQSPYEAFDAILGFRGPYPAKIHPIAVHEEYLTCLLTDLLKACPQLLIGPKPARTPPRPFILIAAAIEANDPRFADTILSGLKDRSIDVKLASVHGIRHCAFLHTPAVKQQLQRLMTMKSIVRDAYSLAQFREALHAIDGRHA